MPTRHEGLGGVGWSIGIGRGGAQGEISGYREVCHIYIYVYVERYTHMCDYVCHDVCKHDVIRSDSIG
jgi:hypothetical protein